MRGWILNKLAVNDLTAESYGAHRLIAEATRRGFSLSVVSPRQLDIIVNCQKTSQFLLNGQIVPVPDFVLNRMGSSTNYYALAIMRQMENAGVFLPNNAASVEVSRDKMRTLQILSLRGLPIVKSLLAKYPTDVDLVEREIGFPLIVKTLSGSQGRGVFLCETRGQFEDLLGVLTNSRANPNFIIQEFVSGSRGKDLRVFVVGGKVVGCMLRMAAAGTFKANFSCGGKVFRYSTTPYIERLALETAEALGLEIAGVDLLFDGNGFRICEANSSPGFQGMEECCEVNIPGAIFEYIAASLQERRTSLAIT